MRKVLLSVIILFIGSAVRGQNYQCLQSSVKHFFINSNNYLRGIRIDSVRTYTDSTIFFPFHTPRGPYTFTSPPVLDPNGGSWLGKKVIQLSDGTTLFDNYWKDSIIILTQANVGESWTFYNDSGSLYYVATVIAKDTMTVLSTLDSVKQIKINTFDGSGALPYDSLDNLTLILSKDHGFVQVFDLYTFPYHKPNLAYTPGLDYFLDMPFKNYYSAFAFSKGNIAFNLVEFTNPNDWEMSSWSVGDRFNSKNYCSTLPSLSCEKYFASEVVSKIVSGHVVTYTLTGTTSAPCSTACYAPVHIDDAGVYSFNDTQYSILSPSEMPEAHFNYGSYFYYFPYDSSYCRKSPLYIKKPLDYVPLGLGYHEERYTLKAGIGLVGYHHLDGEPWQLDAYLTYYSISGTNCGIPLSINENPRGLTSLTIAPNPATTTLTVTTNNPHNTINIRNPIGQTVKQLRTSKSEERINVSDIPAGIYFITVTDSDGNSTTVKEFVVH